VTGKPWLELGSILIFFKATISPDSRSAAMNEWKGFIQEVGLLKMAQAYL
jgi:hypothetical protein